MNNSIVPQNDVDNWLAHLEAEGRIVETEDGIDAFMSQDEMATFFGVTVQAVSRLIKNYKKEDPAGFSLYNKLLNTSGGAVRPVKVYNLDIIIYVGYRVHSTEKARAFRERIASMVRTQLATLRREMRYLETDNARLEDRNDFLHKQNIALRYPKGAPGAFLQNSLPRRDRD